MDYEEFRKSPRAIWARAMGQRIKGARLALGMTQEQLGGRLGTDRPRGKGTVGKQLISLWENGINEPSVWDLIAISRALGASLEYLALGSPHNLEPLNPQKPSRRRG